MAGEYPFRLNPVAAGSGISCDARGCFAGRVPLLERRRGSNGQEFWAARAQPDLDEALSTRYGHSVDMSAKLGGLSAIAEALNRSDVFRAQLGTLALRLPDPPESGSGTDPRRLAALLHGSDMLRRAQNSSPPTHDCQSGTCGSSAGGRSSAPQYARDPRVIPAQEVIPFPEIWEMPWMRPWLRPAPPAMPWDYLRPGPVRPDTPWYGPNYYQRKNASPTSPGEPDPYDSERCKEQRADADEFCRGLKRDNKLGTDDYRGFGDTVEQCWRAVVSPECGGASDPGWRIRI
jgi:hypothetical protein